MKRGWVDFHCHLLPALDDGAVDLGASLKMARILADFGFATVYCTPHHIVGVYETAGHRITHGVQLLEREVRQAQIELRLLPGTEYYLDESLPDHLDPALTVGAAGLVLMEPPMQASGTTIMGLVTGVAKRGVKPLLAHPERYHALIAEGRKPGFFGRAASLLRRPPADPTPDLVFRLRQAGCAFQGNLGSFAGVYGDEVRACALRLLSQGIYGCLGSDAHRSDALEAVLNKGLAAVVEVVGEEGAQLLMCGSGLPGAVPPSRQHPDQGLR